MGMGGKRAIRQCCRYARFYSLNSVFNCLKLVKVCAKSGFVGISTDSTKLNGKASAAQG